MTAVIFIFIAVFAFVLINAVLDAAAPITSAQAVLVKKYTVSETDANGFTDKRYRLRFAVEGQTRTFTVSKKEYSLFEENERGTLVYKRHRFVSFSPFEQQSYEQEF
jgi:hypothetical protein